MNVAEAIRMKRAVREFRPEPLPEEVIRAILNAGRRAQSSKNTQPWRFIALRERAALQALAGCGTWAGHLAGAALGVAMVHPDPGEKFQVLFDIGQCASYMQLAAWELGVGSCLASIYDEAQARAVLGFPAEYHLHIALSFGYPLDESTLIRPPKAGGREDLSDLIHWEHW